MNQPTQESDGRHDFDFLFAETTNRADAAGTWKVHNRYLKGRLRGSTEWMEFEARAETRPILGGLGNLDRYWGLRDGKVFEGATLRLYDPAKDEWAIYYATIFGLAICSRRCADGFATVWGSTFRKRNLRARRSSVATVGSRVRMARRAGSRPSRLIAERAGKPTGS